MIIKKNKKTVKNFDTNPNVIRQGDVFLTKINKLPDNVIEYKHPLNNKILQESEITGHHHQFKPEAKVKLFTVPLNEQNKEPSFKFITENQDKYIIVEEPSMLYHGKLFTYDPNLDNTGDHKGILIPEGTYQIGITVEYDYDYNETRKIID